jgi:hypothetical protein
MPEYSTMFDDFLMTDINENIDFCDEVLAAIHRKPIKKDSFCGNVYELEIIADKAILSNFHDDEINSETMALAELQTRLNAWRKKIIAL